MKSYSLLLILTFFSSSSLVIANGKDYELIQRKRQDRVIPIGAAPVVPTFTVIDNPHARVKEETESSCNLQCIKGGLYFVAFSTIGGLAMYGVHEAIKYKLD
jgi:hypothetical protein